MIFSYKFTKMLIFDQNFDVRQTFGVLTKISIFAIKILTLRYFANLD